MVDEIDIVLGGAVVVGAVWSMGRRLKLRNHPEIPKPDSWAAIIVVIAVVPFCATLIIFGIFYSPGGGN